MFLLVANPGSRSGVNGGRIAAAQLALQQAGLEHETLITRPQRAALPEMITRLCSGRYRGVIAMGGDGTFGEVATGLVSSGANIPMGLLATGTGNNQARSFGILPDDIPANVNLIAGGFTAPLDGAQILGRDVNGDVLREDWFFDSAGFGLSANILRLRNEDRQLVEGVPLIEDLYRDEWVYGGAVLKALIRAWVEEERFDVTVDILQNGSRQRLELEGLHDLVLKNTRYYASVWVFDPTASPEDGLMELVPIYGQDQWLAAAIANYDGFPDPLAEPPTDIYRGSSFRLELRPRGNWLDTQVDGDGWIGAEAPLQVEVNVRRHALRLFVPPERA